MAAESALSRVLAGSGGQVDFTGTWTNELGSSVELRQEGSMLTGHYKSQKAAGPNPATGPLVGFVDGELITFTVHWDEYQAITSWTGRLEDEGITALWQMTSREPDGSEWAGITAGADEFWRVDEG